MTQTNTEKVYTHNGKEVKILTVFRKKKNPTALVEDNEGNIFPVEETSLRIAS